MQFFSLLLLKNQIKCCKQSIMCEACTEDKRSLQILNCLNQFFLVYFFTFSTFCMLAHGILLPISLCLCLFSISYRFLNLIHMPIEFFGLWQNPISSIFVHFICCLNVCISSVLREKHVCIQSVLDYLLSEANLLSLYAHAC